MSTARRWLAVLADLIETRDPVWLPLGATPGRWRAMQWGVLLTILGYIAWLFVTV